MDPRFTRSSARRVLATRRGQKSQTTLFPRRGGSDCSLTATGNSALVESNFAN